MQGNSITYYESGNKTAGFGESNNMTFAVAQSSGVNAFEQHWWGFNLYLNDNVSTTAYQMLTAGAGGAALYARLSPAWSAPTAALKAVLYALAAGGAGLATFIFNENEGQGVRIRFTNLPQPVFTGVFSQ